MAEELLGGGLDIDGWSYLKNEVQGKVNEMTDRSLILRSTFPLVMKAKWTKEEDQKNAYDIVVAVMETKSTIEPPWIAERLKRDFDKAFGAPWNVIVGECYSFDIDYDFHFVFYFLYGPVAILAWRCGSVFPCEINHQGERKVRGPQDGM